MDDDDDDDEGKAEVFRCSDSDALLTRRSWKSADHVGVWGDAELFPNGEIDDVEMRRRWMDDDDDDEGKAEVKR